MVLWRRQGRVRGVHHIWQPLNAARPPARYSNYRVMWKTRVTPGIRGIPCQPAPNHVTCGTLGMLPTSPATGVGFPHSRGNHLDHTICTAITNIYVLPYMASYGASMTQSVQWFLHDPRYHEGGKDLLYPGRFWIHLASYLTGTGSSLPMRNEAGHEADQSHFYAVPVFRMRGVIPPLSQ